jgi:hypothetical protein
MPEKTEKPLDVTSIEDAKQKIPDIKVVGNGDLWQLLSKASSKDGGWMKSTKAMQLKTQNGENTGVILQVSTQQGSNVAEALVFIPEAYIVDDENNGRKLVTK